MSCCVFRQEEVPASSQPPLSAAAAAKPSPQKKMLSLFDGDDEEGDGDLFPASTSKPAADSKRKEVSNVTYVFFIHMGIIWICVMFICNVIAIQTYCFLSFFDLS